MPTTSPSTQSGLRPLWVAGTLILILATVGACRSVPNPGGTPALDFALKVSVSEEAARGHIVWAWLPTETLSALRAGRPTDAEFVEMISVLHVTPERALGSVPVEIARVANSGPESSGPGGFMVVFQPHGADIWSAVLGHPSARQFVGWSEPAEQTGKAVTVRLSPGPDPTERSEQCVGERRTLVEIDAPEVAGSVGNETRRRFCVLLPSSYASTPDKRYPVIFLLPGFGGTHTQYTHLARADHDVILVGVDARTAFGASYFFDTAYGGAWEQLIERAVEVIDHRFRTRPNPKHRALLGHSTGGYNSVSLLLRRPDLFGAAAASSPDGLDFGQWLLDGDHVRPQWLQWARVEDALGSPGQMVSYLAQFSAQFSTGSTEGDKRWPFDLESGAIKPKVWAEWNARQPSVLLADPKIAARVKARLSDRIFISVGRNDAFGLFEAARRFHLQLEQLGVPHAWRPTDDGHFSGSDARREAGLAYLVEAMRP